MVFKMHSHFELNFTIEFSKSLSNSSVVARQLIRGAEVQLIFVNQITCHKSRTTFSTICQNKMYLMRLHC
jgi:hypothetical protein